MAWCYSIAQLCVWVETRAMSTVLRDHQGHTGSDGNWTLELNADRILQYSDESLLLLFY